MKDFKMVQKVTQGKFYLILTGLVGLVAIGSIFVGDAQAGVGSSAGGNGVVCFNNTAIPLRIRNPQDANTGLILDEEIQNVTSVTGLDLYEAQKSSSLNGGVTTVVPIGANDSAIDYVLKIGRRFTGITTLFNEKKFQKQLRMFDAPNFYREPQGLEKIDDVGFTGEIDRQHCVIATIIAQDGKPDDNLEIHVDTRLWDNSKHSKQSQGSLLLHEMMYAWQRSDGATDSENARKLVRLLIMNHGLSVYNFLKRVDELFPAGQGPCSTSNGCDNLSQLKMDIKNAFYGINTNVDFPNFGSLTFQSTKNYGDSFSTDGTFYSFATSCSYLDPATWGKFFFADPYDTKGTGFDGATPYLSPCEVWLKKIVADYPRDLNVPADLERVRDTITKVDTSKKQIHDSLDSSLSDSVLAALLSHPGLDQAAREAIQEGVAKARAEIAKSIQATPREFLNSGFPIYDKDGKVIYRDFAEGLVQQYFGLNAIVGYPIPSVTL